MSIILVFDRDPKVADFFGADFSADLQFICVSAWPELLKTMASVTFDLILIHADPDEDVADDLLDEVRSIQKCEILLFSASPKNDLMRLSRRLLADGYIQKILDAEITQLLIQPHLDKRQTLLRPTQASALGSPKHKHLEKTTRVNINQFLREQFSITSPKPSDLSK
ncbi:MAG: hypothetical protein P1V97_16810 [Planctomycetota bacterium]|nr:hypothetical protein [Planctomycetota bacterium]